VIAMQARSNELEGVSNRRVAEVVPEATAMLVAAILADGSTKLPLRKRERRRGPRVPKSKRASHASQEDQKVSELEVEGTGNEAKQ
jgi:hypothetical protein